MTEQEQMQAHGEHLAKALNLRRARREDGKPFDPPRYQLAAGHDSKTAVGVYLTVQHLAEQTRMKPAEKPADPYPVPNAYELASRGS